MFITFIWRELCLFFLKVLVLFLCQKKIFYYFFIIIFLDFIKKNSRTYIKNLRHGSLQMNVLCRYVQFDAWEMIDKGFSGSRIPHFTVCLAMYT